MLHPLSGSSLSNLARILRRHYRDVELKYYGRLASIGAMVALGTPLRLYESLRYRRAIREQPIDEPPIFVLGHWRSGTTNLHNLLLRDPQLSSVSLLHCVLPHLHLTQGRLIGGLIQSWLPAQRPMDAVALGINEPMSEDFGLIGMSTQTHYGSYFFPQRAQEEFRRTVLFEGANGEQEIGRWERDYLQLLRKVTYASEGRRLCLKNPANTGRVPQLLQLFPDAKFVFVRREPLRIHASSCRLMERFLGKFALQSWSGEQIEEFVSLRFESLLERWFRDRDLIPDQNLIELRHEEIVRDPVAAVEEIYRTFDQPGFEDLRQDLSAYAKSLDDYQNNVYAIDESYAARVQPYVGAVADAWGYEKR